MSEVESGEEAGILEGKQGERKKRVGKSIGDWFGAAFTGYGMKSGGRGNANRW